MSSFAYLSTIIDRTNAGISTENASTKDMLANEPNSHMRALDILSPENTIITVCTAEKTKPTTTPDRTYELVVPPARCASSMVVPNATRPPTMADAAVRYME